MKKYAYLLKNIGLLTLSNFATKLLSFFLVPLYTSVLSTDEYGTYDLFYTTSYLLIPILSINLVESVIRFCLDKSKDTKEVVSISLKMILIGLIPFSVLIIINSIFNIFEVFNTYLVFFIFMYLSIGINQFMFNIARGIDKVKSVSIAGVLNTIVMLSLNLLLLLKFKLGLEGYFIAYISGLSVSSLFLIIDTKIWKYISFKSKNILLKKEMVAYSAPLMINSISWWINNSSDRYIVIALCGMAENGIYSVGYKIPSILNILQSIFNQAWILSSVKEFDPEDKDGFFAKTYKAYNCLLVVVCSLIIIFTKVLAKFLYANDFYEAWKYVPFLTISIIFGAVSGHLGGIFSAVKDSKSFSRTTIVGAAANIILNLIFIHFLGTIGAAIATMVSYIIVWAMRIIYAKKYIKLRLNLKKDIFNYILLIVQSALLFIISNNIVLYICEFALLFIIAATYNYEIKLIVQKIFNRTGGHAAQNGNHQ